MNQNAENINVVWEPIPGTSQEIAISSPCHHTLMCGTRGGGKTSLQIHFFKQHVGRGYGKHWRGIIFDVEHKNLDDLVAQSSLFFEQYEDGGKFSKSASGYKWTWPTGEELLFRHIKNKDEYQKYHGHQYPFIGWNELTKYPTGEIYDLMCSTNRSGFVPEIHTPKKLDGSGNPLKDENGNIIYDTEDGKILPPIPLQVFSTTNPSGPGHNWVKRRFINVGEYGQVIKRTIEVYSPKLKKMVDVEITQVALFSSYRENIYLDEKYIADLNRATENNENLRKAWLEGSWDVTSGGALDDLWNSDIHVIPRFKVPDGWYIDRSFDWGSTTPFSIGWWAEANGETVVLPDGREFTPERGSLIQFFEWYGTKEIGTNIGLRLSASEICDGIIEREIELMEGGWIQKQPRPGPADNQISNDIRSNFDTIEKEMENKGILWEKSDKSRGSRINGLQIFREMLESAIKGEGPAVYFMHNCEASRETIPYLPRDDKNPDDVLKGSEDHTYDMARYRLANRGNRVISGGSYY